MPKGGETRGAQHEDELDIRIAGGALFSTNNNRDFTELDLDLELWRTGAATKRIVRSEVQVLIVVAR